VSSGRITLNGAELFAPRNFGQNVELLETSVDLLPANHLTVELASAPSSTLDVSVSAYVDADTQVSQSTGVMGPSGGTIGLSDVATLSLPPGALPSSTGVELSSITSPLMDFLAPTLGSSFTLLPVPKLRIKSGQRFAEPTRMFVPLQTTIPTGSEAVFLALIRQSGANGEAVDTLMPIGGTPCGDQRAVCVTLLPDWFAETNPADPNDPVLQIAVAIHPVHTSSLHLWEVPHYQLQPIPGMLNFYHNQTLDVSARVLLHKNFDLQAGSPLATDVVLSPFGFRASPPEFHLGVDLEAVRQSPVVAILSGVTGPVRYGPEQKSRVLTCANGTSVTGGFGNRIWELHGADEGLQSLYGHLQTILVAPGQATSIGQQLAISGNTGASCGPHLHFGLTLLDQYVDPEPLLPTVNNLNRYLPYTAAVTIDGTYVADAGGTIFDAVSTLDTTIGRHFSSGTLSTFGTGDHVMSLELQSTGLGVRSLVQWTVHIQPSASTITVDLIGDGTGAITSTPPGISCSGLAPVQSPSDWHRRHTVRCSNDDSHWRVRSFDHGPDSRSEHG
jgi:hypothetical protein